MPVYIRYQGWCIYFWSNENGEPIHFHIAQGRPTEGATKVWILKNDTFRLANNNSRVPQKVIRRLLPIMRTMLGGYKEVWAQYQGNIRYIDE